MLIEAAVLICKLEDDRLYAPWQVVASGYDRKSQRKDYDRLRLNLGEWTRYHNIRETFENRDASGKRIGRFPAWYGRTWKEHLGYRDLVAATDWIQKNEDAQAGENQDPSIHSNSKSATTLAGSFTSHRKPKRRNSRLLWMSVAAVLLLALLLIHPPISAHKDLTLASASSDPQPTQSVSLNEIQQFSSERIAARAARTPLRRAPIVHPPIHQLTWEMDVVEDPGFQAAFSPNCVFLVTRTHAGMMPVPD